MADEELSKKMLDMFCAAARKKTSYDWSVENWDDGFVVLMRFKTKRPPAPRPGEISGAIYVRSNSLPGLADALVRTFTTPTNLMGPRWPLEFMTGCGSVEEAAVKLAAYAEGEVPDV